MYPSLMHLSRKFNLWIRPLSYCLECGGGKKLLVGDCIPLSPIKMMSTVRLLCFDFSFVYEILKSV